MSEEAKREEHSTKKRKKKTPQAEMSFLEHLEELRWHIIRSVVLVAVFAVAAFIMKDFIFNEIIFKPKMPEFWSNRMMAKLGEYVGSDALNINQHPLKLVSLKMADQFMLHFMVAIVLGLILAAPFIFFEIWRFIKPALYDKERKHASGAVFFTSLLFMIGILFGYFIIVPLSIDFLTTYSVSPEVENQINMRSYIGTVTSITFASGFIFLLPIFSFFLSKVGILTPKFMKSYRRHAYVVMFLVSAIITPPDVFSQIMVAIPLVVLYEISIFISKIVVKKREKRLNEI
ncbi:MAG TPA: twin-arginine translocase subunit TatC [Draconibacterium sp.]|nr:twin-arginine translocase subunit TatC [Draconibacterium sp.]HRX12085.1 twin-arginine translocase subunit TatC [Draconibacterium sp.]